MKAHARTGGRCGIVMVTLSVLLSLASAADNGASLYRTKCAQCHGKNGEGKRSIKAPSLLLNEVKELSDEKIRDFITTRDNGEMERNPSRTLSEKRLTEESNYSDHREHSRDARTAPLT
jgi:mono/diheme cytochrome c family protein